MKARSSSLASEGEGVRLRNCSVIPLIQAARAGQAREEGREQAGMARRVPERAGLGRMAASTALEADTEGTGSTEAGPWSSPSRA